MQRALAVVPFVVLPWLLAVSGASAQQPSPPEVIRLWPDAAPGALGDEQKDQPRLLVHALPAGSPAADAPSRPACVVCPGGGYGGLAMDHEGTQIAAWLGSLGIQAFVLDYRHRGKGYGHPAPLQDVQRALRIVRARVQAGAVAGKQVGVIGFSAGGHLAASASVHHDAGLPTASDPIERQSCRPDFAILCYPVIAFGSDFTHRGSQANLLGKNPPADLVAAMSCERHVAPSTPPTFLWHTGDDAVVPVQNSQVYYEALRAHGVPSELHVFEHGAHGLGLAKDHPAGAWPELARRWLEGRGVIEPKK